MLEGVAFSLRDCFDALRASGTRIEAADVIGGGSRSHVWIVTTAAALNIPLHRLTSGEHSAAFGAARLARMAVTSEAPEVVCTPSTGAEIILRVRSDSGLACSEGPRLTVSLGLQELNLRCSAECLRLPGDGLHRGARDDLL